MKDFIKDEAEFFNEHCGYYAVRNRSLYDNMTQTFLVLNTNLYHPANMANVDKIDPCGQLKWLDQQLRGATDDERVFIVAHIPPGYFELWTEEPFFGDEGVTAKYLQIVGKRSNAQKFAFLRFEVSFRQFKWVFKELLFYSITNLSIKIRNQGWIQIII